jgi:hypothetical protein
MCLYGAWTDPAGVFQRKHALSFDAVWLAFHIYEPHLKCVRVLYVDRSPTSCIEWSPTVHAQFPPAFRRAAVEVLKCHRFGPLRILHKDLVYHVLKQLINVWPLGCVAMGDPLLECSGGYVARGGEHRTEDVLAMKPHCRYSTVICKRHYEKGFSLPNILSRRKEWISCCRRLPWYALDWISGRDVAFFGDQSESEEPAFKEGMLVKVGDGQKEGVVVAVTAEGRVEVRLADHTVISAPRHQLALTHPTADW